VVVSAWITAAAVLAAGCGAGGERGDRAVQAAGAAEDGAAPTEPDAPEAPGADTGAAGGAADDAGAAGDQDAAANEDAAEQAAPTTTAPATPPLTRPDWLGTRVLDPTAPPPPTPAELDPRRLPTIDALPPPADGGFHATVARVPREVAARSTWQPACPVRLDQLRYVTVSFWGFDDRAHTGELLVHQDAADPLVGVFRRLFELRFPIEDMRVTSQAELDAPNTGDGNATAAFVCRPTRGGSRWSEHAYGLAVDVNPFQNPYARRGSVIPGLASSYLDRAHVRPGMIVPGGGVIEAFGSIGWAWGGAWRSPVDYMHFSAAGR
jgi:D-alanyl-D-alanine carboxypeptidase